jgi:methyl acetate hydrolase
VAQGGAAQSRHIDALLRQASETKEVPGVVAMAANDKGLIYEGAFGTRVLRRARR